MGSGVLKPGGHYPILVRFGTLTHAGLYMIAPGVIVAVHEEA